MSGLMKTVRGSFYKKEMWVSICSIHQESREDCEMCKAGYWSNVWMHKISNAIYTVTPNIWRWYMNRGRSNNKLKKQLKNWFPNLK